jgi:hypothetical protein
VRQSEAAGVYFPPEAGTQRRPGKAGNTFSFDYIEFTEDLQRF